MIGIGPKLETKSISMRAFAPSCFTIFRELRHVQERAYVTSTDVARQHWTGFVFTSCNDPRLGQADPIARELSVSVVAVWVKAREKLINGEAREKRVDTDDRWPLFLDACDVFLSKQRCVPLRVLPSQRSGLNVGRRVHAAAQQARPAWLEVVDRAANLVDSASTIRH